MSDRCHRCDCRLSPDHDNWDERHQYCSECFDGRFGKQAAEVISGLRERAETAKTRADTAIDLLRTLEWAGDQDGWAVCPTCHMTEEQKHADDCALLALIRPA
jgi:hypothetical protein